MMAIKRLEILFLLTGVVLLIPCLILHDETLDVTVHSTYFVIGYDRVGILFFLYHGFLSLIYLVICRYRNYRMGLWHLVLGIPLFLSMIFSAFLVMGAGDRYYTSGDVEPAFDLFFPDSIYYVIALFLVAQVLFLINVFITLWRLVKNLKQKR